MSFRTENKSAIQPFRAAAVYVDYWTQYKLLSVHHNLQLRKPQKKAKSVQTKL